MTIKRKNIRPGGLLEVETDNTDIVDTNGFSDPIQTVSAKTAKFSGGGVMQANGGLRIGLTQLKINTSTEIKRNRSIVSSDFTVANNIIDNNDNTFASNGIVGATAIIDFTSIGTEELVTILGNISTGTAQVSVEISDDNISYTLIGTFAQGAGSKNTRNHGIQTWRFVRIIFVSEGPTSPVVAVYEVREESSISSDVTVKVRSSTTIDTANGTILITDQVMTPSQQLVFDTDLLLTGNPTGDFVTVEIVSQNGFPFVVTLSEITSIKEV